MDNLTFFRETFIVTSLKNSCDITYLKHRKRQYVKPSEAIGKKYLLYCKD